MIFESERQPSLHGSSVIVAPNKALERNPTLAAACLRARHAVLQEIRKDPERYYAFRADATGFPIAVVKESAPLSQFPVSAYLAAGVSALEDVKSLLLVENLIRQDFNLAQWQVAGIRFPTCRAACASQASVYVAQLLRASHWARENRNASRIALAERKNFLLQDSLISQKIDLDRWSDSGPLDRALRDFAEQSSKLAYTD